MQSKQATNHIKSIQQMLQAVTKRLALRDEFGIFGFSQRELTDLQKRLIRQWRLDRSWTIAKNICLVGVLPVILAIYLNHHLFIGTAGTIQAITLMSLACLLVIFAFVLHRKKSPSLPIMYLGGILTASLALFCLASWLHFSLSAINITAGAENVAGFIYAAGGFFLAFSVFSLGFAMPFFMICHAVLGLIIWYQHEPSTIFEWAAVVIDADIFSTALFMLYIMQSNEMALLEQNRRELVIQNKDLNLRKLETDLEIAQITHESLTPPPEIQSCGNFEIRTYRLPFGLLGGDWLACQRLSADSMIIAVGDASGKGVQAAMVVQSVQTLWARHLSDNQPHIASFLQSVGQSLYTLGQKHPLTMSMGLLFIQGDQLFYYSAGHIPIVVIQDEDVHLINGVGHILGQEPQAQFEPVYLPAPSPTCQSYTILFGTDGALPWSRRRRPKSLIKLSTDVQESGLAALKSASVDDDQILVMISRRDLLRRSA